MECCGGKIGGSYGREGATPERCLLTWCELLGLSTAGGIWQLYGRLKAHLASEERRFLIVIDDVWAPGDLHPLMVAGPQSRVLITGREVQVLDQAGVVAERIEVPVMTGEECLAVVDKHTAGIGRDQHQAIAFLERVGRVPMAVEIGAGLARDRGWDWLRERTEENVVAALRRGQRPGRYDSMAVAVALSYGRLGEAERMVLALLDTWPREKPFGAREVEAMCPPPVLGAIARCGTDIPTVLYELRERSLLRRAGKTADFILPVLIDSGAATHNP